MLGVCLVISCGALAINVLATPAHSPQGVQQQGKTEIIRGVPPGNGQTAKQPATSTSQATALPPTWLNSLRQAADADELSIDELAFAVSVFSAAPAGATDDSRPSTHADQTANDVSWLSDWLTSTDTPFAGAALDAQAAHSLADFFTAQANFAALRNSDDLTLKQGANDKLIAAADKAFGDLLQSHAAGKVSTNQLVMGLNWILDARLAQTDPTIEDADATITLNNFHQTLGRVAEIYSITQAGTNTPDFMKARYYFSRSQALIARVAGKQNTTAVATKHAMQHALSRYRVVMASAPLNQQNLFELTEAAKNRADSLNRFAAFRGDAAMANRAKLEFQAALRMLQNEVGRRDDSPRNRAVAQMLKSLQ